MFENLQVFENRYEELNAKLYDPASAADRELFAALMKEHKELEPIVEAYRAWRQCRQDLAGARELLEDTHDRDLRELAQEEVKEGEGKLQELEERLKVLLLPKDPNDGKNVIVEIRGALAARRPPCSPTTSTACTPPTPNAGAGAQRSSPSTRQSWGALRRSASWWTGRGPTPA